MTSPFKDLFSAGAAAYAQFRPSYPPALFDWLAKTAARREAAIDVGSGNGQAAVALAERFQRVLAVDPSAAQLANAMAHPRVEYRRAPAEATRAPTDGADLIAAGQAFHWFRHEAFFEEVRRVARPGGQALLAVWCYAMARITPEVDAVVDELYTDYMGPYWEPERRLVEGLYRQVEVPFEELPVPAFDMRAAWAFEHLVGYLGTWSPLERYIEAHGRNPIEAVLPRLERAWGDAADRAVTWALGVRAFRV